MHRAKELIIGSLLLSGVVAWALDRVEARRSGVSMRGYKTGATEFQFGVQVSGTLGQKIEQLQRELRLLEFARDIFPPLSDKITYAGTNRPMSQCLADLSARIGEPIPMEIGTNDFRAKEFVFEGIPLVDALKYLVAFDDAILDASGERLVRKPVRQALSLNESEYDLLHLMTRQQFKAVEKILARKPMNVQKIQDSEGQSLLHHAAWHNQTSIAKRLIALGVDIDARDHAGYTPLHEAVRFGNRECADLLLKKGADATLADNNNNTALQTAIYFGHLDTARDLVAHGATLDLFTASALGLVDRVQAMLDKAAGHPTKPEAFGDKQAGAGMTIVTDTTDALRKSPGSYARIYNVTPLHWAARGGSVEVASLLVSRGALVAATDSRGETPLFWAADEGRLAAAEFLVEHGADVNATNYFGGTPLLTAARDTVSPELVKFLIKAGADVNARDSGGENALHKLAWYGYPRRNVETARRLLDAGGDIAARNKDGKTPLDVLTENSLRNQDLVELYRTYAAKAALGRGK